MNRVYSNGPAKDFVMNPFSRLLGQVMEPVGPARDPAWLEAASECRPEAFFELAQCSMTAAC